MFRRDPSLRKRASPTSLKLLPHAFAGDLTGECDQTLRLRAVRVRAGANKPYLHEHKNRIRAAAFLAVMMSHFMFNSCSPINHLLASAPRSLLSDNIITRAPAHAGRVLWSERALCVGVTFLFPPTPRIPSLDVSLGRGLLPKREVFPLAADIAAGAGRRLAPPRHSRERGLCPVLHKPEL